MFGSHCLKTHIQMQEIIALSSGESEFYGIVKAATMWRGEFGTRTCASWGCKREFAEESCPSTRFVEKTASPAAQPNTSSETKWRCTWKKAGLQGEKGDASCALTLEMFKSFVKV